MSPQEIVACPADRQLVREGINGSPSLIQCLESPSTNPNSGSTGRPKIFPKIIPMLRVTGRQKIFLVQGRSPFGNPYYSAEQLRNMFMSSQNSVNSIFAKATFGRLQFDFFYGGVIDLSARCTTDGGYDFFNLVRDHLQAHPEFGTASDYFATITTSPAVGCSESAASAGGGGIHIYEGTEPNQFIAFMTHELGHLLYLGHSGLLDCSGPGLSENGRYGDYMDFTTIMAGGIPMQQTFLATQLSVFGDLTDENVVDATSGVHRIYPRGTNPLAKLPLVLRAPIDIMSPRFIASSLRNYYALEYQTQVTPALPDIVMGVQLRTAGDFGGSGFLARNGQWVTLKNINDSYSDEENGLKFTLRGITSNYADIEVQRLPRPALRLRFTSFRPFNCHSLEVEFQTDVSANVEPFALLSDPYDGAVGQMCANLRMTGSVDTRAQSRAPRSIFGKNI